MIFGEAVVDFTQNFLIKLRLYGKNDSFCGSDYFVVIQSGHNAEIFFIAGFSLWGKVGNDDLLFGKNSLAENAADHGRTHISASDKSNLHNKILLKIIYKKRHA